MHKENTIQSSRLPNKIRTTLMATSSAVIMACACQISTAYAEDKQQTNIAQKELGAALLQIAQQRNANIIYNPELLQGKMASEVKGNFTTHEALHQILKNSGYKVELDKKGNFYIRKQSVHKTSSLNKDNPSTKKLAQNFTAIKSDAHAGQEQTRTPKCQ